MKFSQGIVAAGLRFAILGAAVASFGWGADANAADPPVRLVWNGPGMTQIAADVAMQKGYWKAQGLNLEILKVSGGSDVIRAVLSGSADVGYVFYEHMILLRAQHQELQAFGLAMDKPGLDIIASSKKGINRLQDLKGHPVGVSAPGSGTHLFLNYALSSVGVQPGSFQVVGVGLGATAVAALEQDNVRAISTAEPTTTMVLERDPGATILVDSSDPASVKQMMGASSYPAIGLFAKKSWVTANPAAAQKLAAGLQQALDFIQSSTPEVVYAAVPNSLGDKKIALKVLARSAATVSKSTCYSKEGVDAVYKVQVSSNKDVAAAKIDLADTYTNKFCKQ